MTWMSRLKDSRMAAALLMCGIIFLSILGLRRTGRLEPLELAAYDWFVTIQPKIGSPHSQIALIAISDDDIHDLGRWPLTDAALAEVLGTVLSHGPRAVGVDIFRDIPVPPGTEELDTLFQTHRQIVTVTKFGEGGLPPPPGVQHRDQVGFNDVLVDAGGTVRRALLFLDDGETPYASLAYRLVVRYLRPEGIVPRGDPADPRHVRLGAGTIRPLQAQDGSYVDADDRGYQFLLDYKDDPHSFPSFTLRELMSGKGVGNILRDRIVLIGVAAHGVKDFFFTPYSRILPPDEQVSGIVLHAHTVSQLLRMASGWSVPMRTLPEAWETVWILLSCLAGGTVALWVHAVWRFALWLAAGLLALGVVAFSAFLLAWWIPLVPPWLGWLGSASVATAYTSNRERKQRAVLMQIFSRHVSPILAETIWRQRDQFMDGGRPRSQKVTATILFSDLQGFTPVVEKMDPLVLTEWLNTYMDSMAQLVMDHGGVVDDYAGDGIKANFGLPLPRTTEEEIRRDALNAVTCAAAMAEQMERLNREWRDRSLPRGRIRIGISTGSVVVATIGSAQRLKYTTVGNHVNIAARLESYDKLSESAWMNGRPCRVLLSESTARLVGDAFPMEEVGELSLKGQDQKTRVYFVRGPARERAPASDGEEGGR